LDFSFHIQAQTKASITESSKFVGLANTPPIGWNSWNTFATNIDENLIMQTADIIVNSGMKDAGYT
jgi:alpha-galactosidase